MSGSSIRHNFSDERGFTLIELLVAVSIVSLLLTLSASALRIFWLQQGLDGAANDARVEMRRLQQRAESESHPLVYGAWFVQDSSSWGVVRYSASTGNCSLIDRLSFDAGVIVSAVTGLDSPSSLISACRSALDAAGVPSASSARMAFFYARGTANQGSVTVLQPSLRRTETVQVTPLTGRVS